MYWYIFFFDEKSYRILHVLVVDFQVFYTKIKKILKLSLHFSFGFFVSKLKKTLIYLLKML